jgi:aldehyde:ferredoxin oxidoreductase
MSKKRSVDLTRCGELSNRAKLNWRQVEEIRQSELPERTLAEIYRCHRSNIGCIRRGESWTVTELKAYLHPKRKPTPKHWYAYDVEYDGDLIVTDSRDPDHDLARALLARGIKGRVTMLDGKTHTPRTIINIEKAAKLTVSEESRDGLRVRPYRENPDKRPYSPEEPLVLVTMPLTDNEAA